MILYFSGTGNSKYVANKIATITSDEVINLNSYIKNNETLDIKDHQRIIIVSPTYAWQIPHILRDYLNTLNYKANAIYFVMTCGSDIGGADKVNKEFADKNSLIYRGTIKVVMPENYIAMFNTPSKEKAIQIVFNAESTIKEIAAYILLDNPFPIIKDNIYNTLTSSTINKVFYNNSVSDKKFTVNNNCTSCGLCEKLCPLNNIKLVNGKVTYNGNCTHCMACISYCPTEAIEYGNISKGKRRYTIESLNLE